MSAEHDAIIEQIEAWLGKADLSERPDLVLNAALDELAMTRQRGAGLVRRFADLNLFAQLASTAAALAAVVLVGALVAGGLRLDLGPRVGGPQATATPQATRAPSRTPWPEAPPFTYPAPPPPHGMLPWGRPSVGDLLPGRYSVTLWGETVSFGIPSSGWESFGSFYVTKDTVSYQDAEAIVLWNAFPDGVYADPCHSLLGRSLGPSAADLASAVAATPGTELVTGPSDVIVGGLPAKHVVVTVREDVGCDPGFFYTWSYYGGGAFWQVTRPGDTIGIWIVEVHGERIFIEAETRWWAGDAVNREIQEIIDSISFGP